VRRVLLIAAVFLLANFLLAKAPAFAGNVGFKEVRIANGTEPPLTAGIWYPIEPPVAKRPWVTPNQTVAQASVIAGRALPLVVMSHCGAGSYDSHYDTAEALAQAGFVVAAVSHAGDNYSDQSKIVQLWRRNAQLHRLVDYMLQGWSWHARLDAGRIGAFGFSNGAFTVLVAAGGVPDLTKVGPYCRAHPDHDLCQSLQNAGVSPDLGGDVPADAWVPDPRIKAIVIAAPAYGFTFSGTGLRSVTLPIQLWRAGEDRQQPMAYYDEAVRAALPKTPEYHLVANASHFDFLPPCDERFAQSDRDVCTSRPGFDRAAFHNRFNTEVVRFFETELR
jgi:predicted dienelactone hydrolase